MKIRLIDDYRTCVRLWAALGPPAGPFDLWGVRDCFHQAFRRRLRFVVTENRGEIVGLLPLSWIDESGCWVFFPGEAYHGRTWLEGNRFLASDAGMLRRMIDAVGGPVQLRYVERLSFPSGLEGVEEDEVGYLFYPAAYSYSFEEYRSHFPRKSLKGLIQDVHRLESRGVDVRYDRENDLEILFEMNLAAYGEASYFHDPRFLGGFRSTVSWLCDRGILRITTVLIEGRVAAVDVGALWNRNYTLLAGGVSPEFRGVAKLINFHHLGRACRERFHSVDFLCGDFGWKDRFRLTRCPLYQLTTCLPSATTIAS